MTYIELITNVDAAYTAICDRMQKCKEENELHGIIMTRVTFEDIDLEDILESILLPLLPELIDRYTNLPVETRVKAYRVYVGTLCELVKNGLVNGGILKTMDARMGCVFDRNHHYDLLHRALIHEGIPIIQKHRKYEETIINEAGIPRGYRKKCLEIFSIYWKWTKNVDYISRKKFIIDYFNGNPVDKIYIVDNNDSSRLQYLRSETCSFSEKVIKTCLKLDAVFSAIDNYPESISEENISTVAIEISSLVGFNVYSVLRSTDISQYILEYVKRVSFLKFSRMLDNLPSGETIVLPNGTRKRISEYKFDNYIGGRHTIRGNSYEVSFPLSLDIDSIYKLPRYEVTMFGNAVVYTSDEPIFAEIDGIQKTGRTFVNQEGEMLYVFYERISPATFAYIDGQPVNIQEPFSKRTFIGKYWDHEIKRYKLALFLADIKFASNAHNMRPVYISCNERIIYKGATNSHGALRISDKIIDLDTDDLSAPLVLRFYCNNELVETWELIPEEYYLWTSQTGIRIKDEIVLSEWIGAHRAILFTKTLEENNGPTEYLYDSQGFHVYSVQIDFSEELLALNSVTVPIITADYPYLTLNSSFEINSQQICLTENTPIAVSLENADVRTCDAIIQIEHENDLASYNLRNLETQDLQDIRKLINGDESTRAIRSYAGGWKISLYQNNRRISTIDLVVIPNIRIELSREVFAEGSVVTACAVSTYPCFESEGEFLERKELSLGNASLSLDENYVYVKPISVSVFIDRCGISKEYQVIPRVWGIRKKNEVTQIWNNAPIRTIPVEELMDNSVYVCSTGNTSVHIKTKDDTMHRYIVPGFNKINCKRMFDSWNYKNQVDFTDEYGSILGFGIDCNPRLECIGKEQVDNDFLYYIRYTGPVSTTLQIRTFSGSRLGAQILRNVFQNKFVVKVRIGWQYVEEKEVTIEAKVGDQDYQTILSEKVHILPKEPADQPCTFRITNNTSLFQLLEYRCDHKTLPKRRDRFHIIAMLERGGRQ